ncbi:MAG: hypothetical protein HFG55_06755 [Lachnospiraceae bacterium]|nr:hypothetical protein [Lachnospiraceae bacterium]
MNKGKSSSGSLTPLKIICTAGVIFFVAAIFIAVYMMANNMGQVAGIDFGPGQYYYTDIPGWQKYFLPDHYENPVPLGVLLFLFFSWGFLMYRLWTYLDQKLK